MDTIMTEKRQQMVAAQLERRDISDPLVLQAMRKVPRHEFIPDDRLSEAYEDHPLPIGYGQTISQPYIVAYMTQAVGLTGGEKCLEIGTGSGYQAAILAEICTDVYTVEIVEQLGIRSKQLLDVLGYQNVHVRIGDGYRGWPEQAPFDAIIVTAAPEHVPEHLVDQIKEGGRMIIPVGSWSQNLILITRKNNKLKKRSILPVRFVPMTGEAQH